MIGKALRLVILAAVLIGAWRLRGSLEGVGMVLKAAGPIALPIVALTHLLPMLLCGLAWKSLLPGGRVVVFVLGRWLREAVGELAGLVPLSGELAGAHLLTRRGIRPALAGALTVVDVTAEVAAQLLFSLIGVALWLLRHPASEVVRWGVAGLVASLPLVVGLVLVQRSAVMHLADRLMPGADESMRAGILKLWDDTPRIGRAIGVHLAAWLISTAEAGVGLLLLGHALPPADVVAMESMVFALRSIAFMVPAALGIQEGGYLLVGAALGLTPEVALALSLLKRGRELTLGVPALLAWRWLA
jgi:putative membrane protein